MLLDKAREEYGFKQTKGLTVQSVDHWNRCGLLSASSRPLDSAIWRTRHLPAHINEVQFESEHRCFIKQRGGNTLFGGHEGFMEECEGNNNFVIFSFL